MKRTLTAGVGAFSLALAAIPANSADIPARTPIAKAPPPVPAFTWTGCYVGVHAGGGWGDTSLHPTSPGGFTASTDTSGWFAGGQIGCNWQYSPNWVWGVEADAAWSDIDGASPFDAPLGAFTFHSDLRAFGTVRGRVGWAVDRTLLYATGGLAWGNHRAEASVGGVTLATDSQTHLGWTVGAGVEYAFAGNWSAKLEYLFLDFGKETYAGAGFTAPIDVEVHTVKVGLNYRF